MPVPKKIVLVGGKSTDEYYNATRAVHDRYPLASVYDPSRVPQQARKPITSARISTWADAVILIGDTDEAKVNLESAKNAGVAVLVLRDGKIEKE